MTAVIELLQEFVLSVTITCSGWGCSTA